MAYIDRDKIPYYLDIGEETPIEGRKIAFKSDIDKIPTVNIEDVKHGKWIFSRKEWGSSDHYQDVYYKCSNCGKEYEQFDIDEANYCPNCGAKMDGGIIT